MLHQEPVTWSHFTWLALVPLLSEVLGICDVFHFLPSKKIRERYEYVSPLTLKQGKMSQLNSVSIHEWNEWFFPAPTTQEAVRKLAIMEMQDGLVSIETSIFLAVIPSWWLHPRKQTGGYPKWWNSLEKVDSFEIWPFLISMLDSWGVPSLQLTASLPPENGWERKMIHFLNLAFRPIFSLANC